MSTVPIIVSRTRSRKTPEGGGFSVKRINSTFNELSRDIQELQSVYNNTLRPLIAQLPLGILDADNATDTPIGDALDAIKNGLSGDQVWTDNTATNKSSVLFWDGGRKLTIKETILKLAGQLDASITAINQAFFQINNDPISDYTKAYIGLKAFDATLTSGPGSMDAQLDAIRAFIGSDGVGDSTPDYSSTVHITQNTSLEAAISALDAAMTASASYTADGLGIELTGTQFSLEIDTTGDTVLSKSANGITAFNNGNWWNARALQGVAISGAAPTADFVLTYNNVSSEWEPRVASGTTYTADGDGLELVGTEFQLELDGDTLTKSASGLKQTRTHSWLHPREFNAHVATTPETLSLIKGAGAAAFAAIVLAYDGMDDEYASLVIEVPRREDGTLPATVQATIYVMGTSVPGGGSGAAFYLHYGLAGTDVDVVGDAETFAGTWGLAESNVFTIANADDVQNFEYATQTLENGVSGLGLINIKISRLAATDAADTYTDDALFLGLGLNWTW